MNPGGAEAAFETVIEAHLLANGYVPVAPDGFDRERAIFPETVLMTTCLAGMATHFLPFNMGCDGGAVNPADKFELVFRNLLERLFVERMDQNEEIFVRFRNDRGYERLCLGDHLDELSFHSRTVNRSSASIRSGSVPLWLRMPRMILRGTPSPVPSIRR